MTFEDYGHKCLNLDKSLGSVAHLLLLMSLYGWFLYWFPLLKVQYRLQLQQQDQQQQSGHADQVRQRVKCKSPV